MSVCNTHVCVVHVFLIAVVGIKEFTMSNTHPNTMSNLELQYVGIILTYSYTSYVSSIAEGLCSKYIKTTEEQNHNRPSHVCTL
jgi:hypothetical protein